MKKSTKMLIISLMILFIVLTIYTILVAPLNRGGDKLLQGYSCGPKDKQCIYSLADSAISESISLFEIVMFISLFVFSILIMLPLLSYWLTKKITKNEKKSGIVFTTCAIILLIFIGFIGVVIAETKCSRNQFFTLAGQPEVREVLPSKIEELRKTESVLQVISDESNAFYATISPVHLEKKSYLAHLCYESLHKEYFITYDAISLPILPSIINIPILVAWLLVFRKYKKIKSEEEII